WRAALPALLMTLTGCVSFSPDADWHHPHLERAQVESTEGISVSAVVLEDEEAKRVYGVDLARMDIRAIWLSIRNDTSETFHLLPSSLDLDYFSQNEAAYRFHSMFRPGQNRSISAHFHDLAIRKDITAHTTTEGYVLVNRHRGGRYLLVELLGDNSLERFDFMFTLPDGSFDFESVDLASLYSPDDLTEIDVEGLARWAESLPCCTTDEDGERDGDPLNVFFVGDTNELMGALTRSGWAFTERTRAVAAWESVKSTLFGSPEFNFPVSPLYVFGRGQDFAMQRPRGSIPQRNHMRLWLSPLTHEGRSVWVAQLSRDIGIKPTWHSPFLLTHVIDPEVDEDRAYLLELLMRTQSVAAYGYVDGVGEATAEAPKYNLSEDPYRTDGRRLVLILAKDPVPINQVSVIPFPGRVRQP
ncbi:MAG: LssY C-terminal domain-containing protein, partial [Woeseiaceae bacterium]|nr:LssY C-terminal domain-containing protein [Woeseiaceae bacterium]